MPRRVVSQSEIGEWHLVSVATSPRNGATAYQPLTVPVDRSNIPYP